MFSLLSTALHKTRKKLMAQSSKPLVFWHKIDTLYVTWIIGFLLTAFCHEILKGCHEKGSDCHALFQVTTFVEKAQALHCQKKEPGGITKCLAVQVTAIYLCMFVNPLTAVPGDCCNSAVSSCLKILVTAMAAASLSRAARSAPTKPGVNLAMP